MRRAHDLNAVPSRSRVEGTVERENGDKGLDSPSTSEASPRHFRREKNGSYVANLEVWTLSIRHVVSLSNTRIYLNGREADGSELPP